MSKAEILAELPSLTPEERYEILVKLNELDGDLWLDREDPLTEHEKELIGTRLEAHERNPESAIPWEEFRTRLNRRIVE
jgi:putative addiction module component (TIGR02574 family)